jgi:peptidoglycan-N-acetylglucosamine deacetylase
MQRPISSRFQVITIAALLLGVLAWTSGSLVLLSFVLATHLTITSLGVALPHLRFFGPFVCRGEAGRRCVALTFDDGPDAQSTPTLLEVLREAGVEAAFFCIGKRVAENPELAARIVREGHLLENHSYTHSHATNCFSVARLQTELTKTQAVIEKATGVAPRCFRPPMGLSNPRVFRVARALGLMVVGWTARGLDTRVTEPERIVARITRALEPGAIILLHDGDVPPERLVVTVKRLLNTVRAQGYEVVRLDRILT